MTATHLEPPSLQKGLQICQLQNGHCSNFSSPPKFKLNLLLPYFLRGKNTLLYRLGRKVVDLPCKFSLCSKGSLRMSAHHLSRESRWIYRADSHTGRMLRTQPPGPETEPQDGLVGKHLKDHLIPKLRPWAGTPSTGCGHSEPHPAWP